jgi:hypothetical protein
MPEYEFHVSNGATANVNKAIRSHAIKTALRMRSKRVAGEDVPDGSATSVQTAQRNKELRGQFRATIASTKDPGHISENKPQLVVGHESISMFVAINMDETCFRNKYSSGVPMFSVNILDPFGAIPIPSNPNIDTLLKHCTSYMFLLRAA